jgi:hypothetical protein
MAEVGEGRMQLFSVTNRSTKEQFSAREELEKRYRSLMKEALHWSPLVSYMGNKQVPLLRLYRFKEAFSLTLALELVQRFRLTTDDLLLDPFCGMGTTLFAGMIKGVPSIGIDRLPVAVFIAQTIPKFFQLRQGSLLEAFHALKAKVQTLELAPIADDVPVMKIAFEHETLMALRRWKTALQLLESPLQEVFQFLLMSILEPCSFMSNDGQFLRWKRNKQPLLPEVALERKVIEAEHDLLRARQLFGEPKRDAIPQVFTGDARKLAEVSLKRPPSAVITSPPYPNRYDYTRSYSLELCFFFVSSFEELKSVRFSLLRSHIESKTNDHDQPRHPAVAEVLQALQRKPLNNPRIPMMLLAYFVDMEQVIRSLAEVCASDASVAMVVDNVRFEGEMVPTDLILCDIATRYGFETEGIIVARYKGNSSQQMRRYGRLPVRESVLFWRLRR